MNKKWFSEKINKLFLLLHFPPEHFGSSLSNPGHFSPPFLGAGLSHFLVLDFCNLKPSCCWFTHCHRMQFEFYIVFGCYCLWSNQINTNGVPRFVLKLLSHLRQVRTCLAISSKRPGHVKCCQIVCSVWKHWMVPFKD